jgi:hypothetical protein
MIGGAKQLTLTALLTHPSDGTKVRLRFRKQGSLKLGMQT